MAASSPFFNILFSLQIFLLAFTLHDLNNLCNITRTLRPGPLRPVSGWLTNCTCSSVFVYG